MAPRNYLLVACLFTIHAMAQTPVNKGDSVATPSTERPIIHVTTTAVPIKGVEDISSMQQVPKEAVQSAGSTEHENGARSEAVHVTVEAVPVGLADTLPSVPKVITGDQNGSSRPGGLIVAPPVTAIKIATVATTTQPEAPSE